MSEARRTIVVGVDYSDQSVFAVDEALRAAATLPGSRLVPVLVLHPGTVAGVPDVAEMTRELLARSSDNLLKLIEARAHAVGVTPGSIEPSVRFGTPADELLAQSHELDADLIAVGTHGRRGLSHLLLGSVAEEVMRRAVCSVLVARAPRRSASVAPRARPSAEVHAAAEAKAATSVAAPPAGATPEPAGVEDAEATVVAGPYVDAGRVVLHVLDVSSSQVFVCSFESEAGVSVEPLEGSWVPAPASAARARAARIALGVAEKDRAQFNELFAEIARRRTSPGR
jgi:universal stress protein A